MTFSQTLKLATIAFAMHASALMAGLLPFNNTVVHPKEYIIHVESAAWIDSNGTRLDLLDQPLQADILQTDVVNLTQSLQMVSRVGFVPHMLEVRIKRYFDITAEASLDTGNGNSVYLHTKSGMPAISVAGVQRLSLADTDMENPTLQRCYFPQSEQIDAKLKRGGIHAEGQTLIYVIPYDNSWDTSKGDILLSIVCNGVEFGDSMVGAPYFIVPHLPYMDLVQANQ